MQEAALAAKSSELSAEPRRRPLRNRRSLAEKSPDLGAGPCDLQPQATAEATEASDLEVGPIGLLPRWRQGPATAPPDRGAGPNLRPPRSAEEPRAKMPHLAGACANDRPQVGVAWQSNRLIYGRPLANGSPGIGEIWRGESGISRRAPADARSEIDYPAEKLKGFGAGAQKRLPRGC